MHGLRLTGWLLLVAALALAPAVSSMAQPSPVVAAISAENAQIGARIEAETAALTQARATLARVLDAIAQLESRLQRIARHAELEASGREFAVMVRSELRALPRPDLLTAEARRRQPVLESASDVSVGAETAALALDDLDAAVTRRLATLASAPADPMARATLEAATRESLAQQRQLLNRLHAVARDRLQVLRDTHLAQADLRKRGEAAQVELTRLLFWLPSPPEFRLMGDMRPAAEWLVSARHWREVAAALHETVQRLPLQSGAILIVAVALLSARGRLRRHLALLAQPSAQDVGARVGGALEALAVTLALALPQSLLFWLGGMLLGASNLNQAFTLALGAALDAVARLLFGLSACVWLLDRHGLAAGHLGWDPASVGYAGSAMRRFTALFVPLMLLAALNALDNAPYGNRETLGRLFFVAGMVVLALLLLRLFRRSSPLMVRLAARAPLAWALRLHPAWLWALLALPMGMLGLALAGYLTAAGYFFGRTVSTLFLVIGAALGYGLVALWIQVQQWTLARQRARQADVPSDAGPNHESGSEIAALMPQAIDLAAIGQQTRALLDLALTVLLMAGLWALWRDALPALTTIGEVALWSFPASDKQPASVIDIADLFQALVISVVTAVVVRNVGALLDTLLLQRLAFQADANYAIKVITRYAVTALGVVLVCDALGLSWTSMQWLVAALGVGLGFGLQEIVANFVSGLIVLAERPVRIGDVVTIGNVTGRVSRIRARATVVVDNDHREVIVPNKGFITERVVNWTLSDTTTRLLLPFSVAHGCDVDTLQQRVLEAVRRTAGVMDEPGPSVFLVGLGETGLNFEVRAYVKTLDEVMRTRHALNTAIEQVLRDLAIARPASGPALSTQPAR